MKKKKKSGRMLFLEGLFLYLIEELKTMNVKKLRALKKIIKGYTKMKLLEKQKGPKALSYKSARIDKKELRSLKSSAHLN